MDDNLKDILAKAVARDGHYRKIDMFSEEAGELLQALNKIKRLSEYSGTVLPPDKNSSVEYCLAYWAVCSEIADVKNVLEQLEMIFNASAVSLSQERKIMRLADKMEHDEKPVKLIVNIL